MKSLWMISVLACVMATGDGQRAEPSPPVLADGTVRLLPGYHYLPSPGVDTSGGKIWIDNGPEIYYVRGPFVGHRAVSYADVNQKVSLTVINSTPTSDIAVALDSEHDILVVSVGNVDFMAHNVRTRKDVLDVVLMASTVPRAPK
jgi:hypothetical protein